MFGSSPSAYFLCGLHGLYKWVTFFRPDHDKISGVQRLVKAYQEEIDALAKRSRASDSAFFSLYKALYEAPDPAQALERMASVRPRAAASEVYCCSARSTLGGGMLRIVSGATV